MLVTQQPVLRRFWYAVMPMDKLANGPQPFTLLGEPIVLWKKSDATPAAVRDRCCHRTTRLSKGFVEGDHIVCGYHGWSDWYLATNLEDAKGLNEHLLSGLEPAGVPSELRGTVLPFAYNRIEELEADVLDRRVEGRGVDLERECRAKREVRAEPHRHRGLVHLAEHVLRGARHRGRGRRGDCRHHIPAHEPAWR